MEVEPKCSLINRSLEIFSFISNINFKYYISKLICWSKKLEKLWSWLRLKTIILMILPKDLKLPSNSYLICRQSMLVWPINQRRIHHFVLYKVWFLRGCKMLLTLSVEFPDDRVNEDIRGRNVPPSYWHGKLQNATVFLEIKYPKTSQTILYSEHLLYIN